LPLSVLFQAVGERRLWAEREADYCKAFIMPEFFAAAERQKMDRLSGKGGMATDRRLNAAIRAIQNASRIKIVGL